jgi:hypothetical protein
MTCGANEISNRRLVQRAGNANNGQILSWDATTKRTKWIDPPSGGSGSDSAEKLTISILGDVETIITEDSNEVMYVNDTDASARILVLRKNVDYPIEVGTRFYFSKTKPGSNITLQPFPGVTVSGLNETSLSVGSKAEVVNIGVDKWVYTETEYKPAIGSMGDDFTISKITFGLVQLLGAVEKDIYIPSDTEDATLPQGFDRSFVQMGTAQWNFTAHPDVIIYTNNVDLKTPEQFSCVRLTKLSYNVWYLEECISRAWVESTIAMGLVGIFTDQGGYTVSNNTYPTAANTIGGVAVKKGFLWTSDGTATYNGKIVTNGDVIRALIDNPGQTHANWAIMEGNFGYTPENAANKKTNLTSPDNDGFPTTLATSTAIAASKLLPSRTIVASDVLVLTDAFKKIRTNIATPNTLTVPLYVDVAYEIGTQIPVFQLGVGQTTITPAVGVTINSIGNKLAAQKSACVLEMVAINEWDLVGNLTA